MSGSGRVTTRIHGTLGAVSACAHVDLDIHTYIHGWARFDAGLVASR